MKTARSISRRRLLRGIAGASLAIPFLPSLAGDSHAAPSGFPKRFIFVSTSNGQKRANWWPEWTPSWTDLSGGVREAPLETDASGHITPVLGPEFQGLKDKLLLLRGLDHYHHAGGGHWVPATLSGSPDGISSVTVDQVLAYSNKVYATPPPVRSVHMMVKQQFQSSGDMVSIDAGGAQVPHETDVTSSYQRLFGGFVEDTPDPTALERQQLKLGVIDRLRGDYDTLAKSPRLSTADRQRLTAHVELVHDLHGRLSASQNGPACSKPDSPASLSNDVDANLPTITQNNIDLLVAAIKCDRVRVGTLMLCPGTDLRNFAFLGLPGGEHHAMSHNTDQSSVMALRAINNWYAQQIADLLTQLDVVEDPSTGATYLDNTVVFWGNEDGCNDYDAHKQFCMPALLAGGGGGYFRTGRYVDFREHGTPIRYGTNNCSGSGGNEPTDDRGHPYNSLLISIMAAMGLSPSDWEASPGAGFGNYDDDYCNGYSQAAGKLPLPHLEA